MRGPWRSWHDPLLFVSAPVLLEARNVFARASRELNSAEWQALVADQGNGLTLTPHDWSEIVAQAEELTDQYAHKGTISSGDSSSSHPLFFPARHGS